jgi:hypothetical protein
MPFIPHTPDDVADMLAVIGVEAIGDLFDEIPAELLVDELAVPTALSEIEVARLMTARAALDGRALNFIGAGAYEHHIPAPADSYYKAHAHPDHSTVLGRRIRPPRLKFSDDRVSGTLERRPRPPICAVLGALGSRCSTRRSPGPERSPVTGAVSAVLNQAHLRRSS